MKRSINLFALIILSLLISCRPDDAESISKPNFPNNLKSAGPDSIALGNQLPNPYTPSAFVEAMESLISKGVINDGDFAVEVTHNYVRLYVDNDAFEYYITMDSNLVTLDFPLDYEIIEDGDYYRDHSIHDTAKYIYAVVPVNYSFHDAISNSIEYISPLVLDDTDENPIYDLIEEESLKLKEVWDSTDYNISSQSSGKVLWGNRYVPKGKIQFTRITDAGANITEGLSGVKITTVKWFKIGYGVTNFQGNFESSRKYRSKVRYRVKWERNPFTLRQGGTHLQLYTKGPYTNNMWNYTIARGHTNAWGAAYTHKACMDWYYGPAMGLNRPPRGFYGRRAKISISRSSIYASAFMPPNGLIGSYIFIRNTDKDFYNGYGTAILELAHSQHWALPGNFLGVDRYITEMYATGIEWFFVRNYYNAEVIMSRFNKQAVPLNLPILNDPCLGYGPIFIDLFDTDNQGPSYLNATAQNECISIGGVLNNSRDGQACLMVTAPQGSTPFILNNRFYYTPIAGGTPCNNDATFDGQNCDCGPAPPAMLSFVDDRSIYTMCNNLHPRQRDLVSGYQPYQWQNALQHAYNLNGFKNNLRNLYFNRGEGARLDTLIADYSHVGSTDNNNCVWQMIFKKS